MPKRLIAFVATLAFIFAVSGCSSGGSSTSSSSGSEASTEASSSAAESPSSEASNDASSSSVSATSSLSDAGDWPLNEITEEVPVPKFSVSPIFVHTSESTVSVTYENIPEKEVSAFIEEVGEAGFIVDAGESISGRSYYTFAGWNDIDRTQSTVLVLSYSSTGRLNITVINLKLR